MSRNFAAWQTCDLEKTTGNMTKEKKEQKCRKNIVEIRQYWDNSYWLTRKDSILIETFLRTLLVTLIECCMNSSMPYIGRT